MALVPHGEPPDMLDYYVKMYNTVVDFKNSLVKIFLETGLSTESTTLDAFKTVTMETHTDITPQLQQLSTDVLLVFNLIAELIHATLLNKSKTQPVEDTSHKASQTDPVADNKMVEITDGTLVKIEKSEDLGGDHSDNFDLPDKADDDVLPAALHPPLRKSSRTSVLNRKPFAKPRKQKPTTKPVGAKKRKQGGVIKILNRGSDKKKTLALISSEPQGKTLRNREVEGRTLKNHEEDKKPVFKKDAPKVARRAAVIATNLYERTSEGLFRCKECGKEAKLQTNIRKHIRKHTAVKQKADSENDRQDETAVGSVYAEGKTRTKDAGVSDESEEEVDKKESLTDGEQEESEMLPAAETLPTGSMYEATVTGLYRCLVCGRETKDRSNIRKHYLKLHAGEKRYQCSKCPKAFTYPESLKHHQKAHLDPSTRVFVRTQSGMYRCKYCEHESKNRSNIVKHVKRRHLNAGEKPYVCSQCPAVFAYPRSLKRHELVHEGIRPYKCAQCDKCFFDPTSLRTHSRVHTNDRPYVCQICGDRFRQNEGLKGHMRRHTGDRPYVCERCGMAFAAKRSLTRHIRVHTGERPYPCDQCVAAFADWTTLHNHKLVHRDPVNTENDGDIQGKNGEGNSTGSENKPYQCQFCGIRYRQPLSLKRHLRLHSSNGPPKKTPTKKPRKRKNQDGEEMEGEESTALHLQYRPYQCEICGEKFKHLRGYDTHKSKHESGTLVAKKTPAKRVKQEPIPQMSNQEIEQAATILASVAVNSTSMAHANNVPMSVLHAPPVNDTVTIIDAAAMNSMPVADPSNVHLAVSSAPPMTNAPDVIHYASDNVTQVIRYPDGTLSQVTALVPHPPPPTILPSVDLGDNVVTLVFETNDGTGVVSNQ